MLILKSKCAVIALILLLLNVLAPTVTAEPWNETLREAAFVKDGLSRLYNPYYQYDFIGLGGTTMRVGHDGFTKSYAPRVSPGGGLEHAPYLMYDTLCDYFSRLIHVVLHIEQNISGVILFQATAPASKISS